MATGVRQLMYEHWAGDQQGGRARTLSFDHVLGPTGNWMPDPTRNPLGGTMGQEAQISTWRLESAREPMNGPSERRLDGVPRTTAGDGPAQGSGAPVNPTFSH